MNNYILLVLIVWGCATIMEFVFSRKEDAPSGSGVGVAFVITLISGIGYYWYLLDKIN
jgi:hypothetical protein